MRPTAHALSFFPDFVNGIAMLRSLLPLAAVALLQACSTTQPTGIGQAVCWDKLPGWQQDQLQQALPALRQQCPRLAREDEGWQALCADPQLASASDADSARRFLEQYFLPHPVYGQQGSADGLITGYYEPTLHGSRSPDERYRFPLYRQPDDLLLVDFGDRFPELKGQRVRARLVERNGRTVVVPYHDRAVIDGEQQPLAGQELLWVDDADDAFFLQVQGSGRIQMDDGSVLAVGYADQNGHAYRAIGKLLIERGELSREDVSMQTIRQWLQQHPQQAQEIRNHNPSYVFFTLRNNPDEGPRGSLNVPLTPERSAAVDRSILPLGTPIWVATTLPDQSAYQRLLLAQDTGGAITGPVRADIFFGRGERAETLAGAMKQNGRIFALQPRSKAEHSQCR